MIFLGFTSNIIDSIINLGITLPGLIIAITLHELAHGLTAYALGDPTAKNNGRLTLNPIVHLDIIGFLMLLIARFGWAKPVPINPLYFKNRKLGTILVSIAGPISNFIIAIISVIILDLGLFTNEILNAIIFVTAWYNVGLGIFNLLPFPPLDGSKILASLLPTKFEMLFYKYERYLYVILIILVLSKGIGTFIGPVVEYGLEIIYRLIFIFK